ncbi:MAG: ribosomal RNA adenine dimethylase [Sphingobacteriales bacterium]|nr:MAG: ribosomal RNA adenine dimethylase [Sphingobacteriales bacterium]
MVKINKMNTSARATKNSFIIEALKSIKTTGTVWPSSPHLIRKMLSPINFSKADCIIEFGVGDGCITRELLQKMKFGSKLLAFEINPQFYNQQLKELKDDKLFLINDSAEKADFYLKQMGIDKAQYVVSSLPLSNLGRAFTESLLSKTKNILAERGRFIQFQYSLSQYSAIKKFFPRTKIKFTALNLPPAIIYVCTKLK